MTAAFLLRYLLRFGYELCCSLNFGCYLQRCILLLLHSSMAYFPELRVSMPATLDQRRVGTMHLVSGLASLSQRLLLKARLWHPLKRVALLWTILSLVYLFKITQALCQSRYHPSSCSLTKCFLLILMFKQSPLHQNRHKPSLKG